MGAIDLVTLLKLVGTLNDSTDPNSPSVRFREYLRTDVHSVGDLRAYIETALSVSGDQYNKALQDLMNHAGQLMGFDVEFGRYRGVAGQIGFDGLWRSPTGRAVVVEVKTTDVYAVKTATLLGYINDLVSAGRLENADQAIGLYVYGRFDAATSQLEKAIVFEKRQERLRVASVDALLNLLELQQEYELEHEAVFRLLLPSPVRVDSIVNLIFDITSQERRAAIEEPLSVTVQPEQASAEEQVSYYLLPAADSEDGLPVLENLHHWLDRGMWGLGQRTGYRRMFQPGDRLCFYAARIGVVAECVATSEAFDLDPTKSPKPHLDVPYGMGIADVRWFEDAPVLLTPEVRGHLSAFQERDLKKGWAWFVQGTSKLTERDFRLLTGRIALAERPAPAADRLVRRGPAPVLVSIPDDYRGQKVRAVLFRGKRYEAHTWKDAMLALFEGLRGQDPARFEETALTLVGRKRPLVTRDSKTLRTAQRIPNTASLYVETNLSANSIAKVCHTLITRMGYEQADLTFETEG
jgi:hypothetical protein